MKSFRTRRPPFTRGLIVLIFIFVGLNAVRAAAALQDRAFLTSLDLAPGPLYLALTGAAAALLLGAAGILLLLRSRAAAWFTRAVGLAYGAWYWADRLWIAQPGDGQVNWPFALAATVVLLGFMGLVTAALLRQQR